MCGLLDWISAEKRERDCESRALTAAVAVRVGRAPMKFNQVPHDCKAQAQSAERARRGRIGLTESLEQMRHERRINPNAIVRNFQLHPRVVTAQLDRNAAALRRKLHGVCE